MTQKKPTKPHQDTYEPAFDEPRWSRVFAHCQNCHTTRRRHVGRGYCGSCYRLVGLVSAAGKWNLKAGRIPSGTPRPHDPNLFERFRYAYIAEVKRHLALLQSRERCWLNGEE